MKIMYPPGYHQNDFVATHALGHMMYIYVNHKATLLKKSYISLQ